MEAGGRDISTCDAADVIKASGLGIVAVKPSFWSTVAGTLAQLNLSHNRLTTLSGLEVCLRLSVLNVYFNQLESEAEIVRLDGLPLQSLDVRLNPVAAMDTQR